MIQKYVAGFLFDDAKAHVALIHKTHGPDAIVGKWNAIGGKLSTALDGQPESSDAAMGREFNEEAGVSVTNWTLFLQLSGQDWEVDFYHAFNTLKLNQVKTAMEEEIIIFPLTNLPEVVPDLRWILPMALGHRDDRVWVCKVIEKETFSARKG
jgi:8-oxo-dGTP pyrophosphatase MutT (NUDIX family)